MKLDKKPWGLWQDPRPHWGWKDYAKIAVVLAFYVGLTLLFMKPWLWA